MNKVLIILLNEDTCQGGISTYNRYLIDLLKQYFNNQLVIDEVVISSRHEITSNSSEINYFYPKYKHVKNLIWNTVYKWKSTRKLVYSLEEKNNYLLILDSTNVYFKKFIKLNKYVWIQHFDYDSYIKKSYENNIIKRLLIRAYNYVFLSRRNEFKKIKNIVIYDETTRQYLQQNKIRKNKSFTVPLCVPKNDVNFQDFDKREKIIFYGRLDEKQKQINALLRINQKLNLIDFYGPVTDELKKEHAQDVNFKRWYKGVVDYQNRNQIIKKYKYMILYSKYEGFSYSLVESLACGVPIIVLDSFLSAKYLCNNETGFLLKKTNTIEQNIQIIKNCYLLSESQYNKLCVSTLNFFKDNLEIKNFNLRWTNILNEILH